MECKLGDILEREGRKITWLANRSKVNRNTITTYINGAVPALDKAYAIATALEKDLQEIWPLPDKK